MRAVPNLIPWLLLIVLGELGLPRAAERLAIVVCAPGYPGDTASAQSTMDGFAAGAEKAAGWPPGGLAAVYHEDERAGLERLGRPDAVAALVPLPFLHKHGKALGLTPRLKVVRETGEASEIWHLVARKGALPEAAALDGWEITGTPGYAPAFVRGPALGAWGVIPASTRITFSRRPLTALRRAASGEKVAVLLDRAQAEALPSLPFAADLEVVARSKPLPDSLFCTVRKRLDPGKVEALVRGLLQLGDSAGGKEVLFSLRLTRFDRVDKTGLVEGAP